MEITTGTGNKIKNENEENEKASKFLLSEWRVLSLRMAF
jgi:hypothetical protein